MSKAIARLLDQPEQIIKKAVAVLEDKNGYPSHDVRHLAENIQNIRHKIADLGLDPNDTTAEELYHALLVKFYKDSLAFDDQFGARSLNIDQRGELAVKLVSKKLKLPRVWAIKTAAAKKLIKAQPPKRTMKLLGYRSVDSLLKRQNLAELSFALERFETAAWSKTYTKAVNLLDSSCFELSDLKLINLSTDKWGPVGANGSVVYSSSFGAMALAINQDLKDSSLLSLVVLLVDGLAVFNDNALEHVTALSPDVAWWRDMDGLIANLGGEPVSLNIADVATSHTSAAGFQGRQLDCGRRSFWQGLVDRYDNLLTAEEDLKMSFERRQVSAFQPINQPAFEYVEDM